MNKPTLIITAAPAPNAPARPRPRISDRIAEPFLDPPPAPHPDPTPVSRRHDGWTPERIRIFLEQLAACGVVEDAARAAGMSKQSAYALRNRAKGRAFHLAWNAALNLARHRLADDLYSRAVHGCVELIVRDGKVWGERHRFDNRFSMAVLARLDRLALAGDEENRNARMVAEEYDEFLDIVCANADGEAADFLASRREADRIFKWCKEADLLHRLDRYVRDGAGIPAEATGGPPAEEEAASAAEKADEWPPSTSSTSLDPEARGERDEWHPSTSSTSAISEPTLGTREGETLTFRLGAGHHEPAGMRPCESTRHAPQETRLAIEDPPRRVRRPRDCGLPSATGWMS